jgi:metallophosphoesterase superfamily enzyme
MIEIYHVSDLHIGRDTRKAKRLLKIIKDRFEIGEQENRWLLVTGDITQDGSKRQYEMALKALTPFKDKICIVPGNHDYGLLGFIYSEYRAKNFDGLLAGGLGIGHQFFPKIPFSELIKEGKENTLLLIGLNSCLKTSSWLDIAEGEIGDKQRSNLERILTKSDYQNIPKIIFLHHIPHRRAHSLGMSLKDFSELMGIVRGKVDALAFGHEGKMEDAEPEIAKKKKISDRDLKRLVDIKAMDLPIREMKLRSGKGQGIRYYLDANYSVREQACYRITIEGRKVSARFLRLT